MGSHRSNKPKMLSHNPPTKQLRRRKTEYATILFYMIHNRVKLINKYN